MDSGYDFLTPEFLHILFFQQKNIVIFPYVDLKHLHSLEIFAVGYNIINLDSTAVHNLVEILEHESYNSYAQNPSLFFISNMNGDQLKQVLALQNIHYVINCTESASKIRPILQEVHNEEEEEREKDIDKDRDRERVIFYNKKNKTFLNFSPEQVDLSVEHTIITSAKNPQMLQDTMVKMKSTAAKLFTEINESSDKKALVSILSEYEKSYWDRILLFTQNYYGIQVPDLPKITLHRKTLKEIHEEKPNEFDGEYTLVMKSHKSVAREFITCLHNYRFNKVNPANLELDQLYSPRELYNYLRARHWRKGIPDDFVREWVQMNNSNYELSATEQDIFSQLLADLPILTTNIDFGSLPKQKHKQKRDTKSDNNTDIEKALGIRKEKLNKDNTIQSVPENKEKPIPSIKDFPRFRAWILDKLDQIETQLGEKKA